jgi:hypothetical protein
MAFDLLAFISLYKNVPAFYLRPQTSSAPLTCVKDPVLPHRIVTNKITVSFPEAANPTLQLLGGSSIGPPDSLHSIGLNDYTCSGIWKPSVFLNSLAITSKFLQLMAINIQTQRLQTRIFYFTKKLEFVNASM